MTKLDEYFKAKQKRLNGSTQPTTSKIIQVKGKKYGLCNVTACQKPGAKWFNKSTKAYYCEHCATGINWSGGHADCMELYGTPYLCEYEA